MIKTDNKDYITIPDTIGKYNIEHLYLYYYINVKESSFSVRISNTSNYTSINWNFTDSLQAATVFTFICKQSVKTLETMIQE